MGTAPDRGTAVRSFAERECPLQVRTIQVEPLQRRDQLGEGDGLAAPVPRLEELQDSLIASHPNLLWTPRLMC